MAGKAESRLIYGLELFNYYLIVGKPQPLKGIYRNMSKIRPAHFSTRRVSRIARKAKSIRFERECKAC